MGAVNLLSPEGRGKRYKAVKIGFDGRRRGGCLRDSRNGPKKRAWRSIDVADDDRRRVRPVAASVERPSTRLLSRAFARAGRGLIEGTFVGKTRPETRSSRWGEHLDDADKERAIISSSTRSQTEAVKPGAVPTFHVQPRKRAITRVLFRVERRARRRRARPTFNGGQDGDGVVSGIKIMGDPRHLRERASPAGTGRLRRDRRRGRRVRHPRVGSRLPVVYGEASFLRNPRQRAP